MQTACSGSALQADNTLPHIDNYDRREMICRNLPTSADQISDPNEQASSGSRFVSRAGTVYHRCRLEWA